MAEKEGSGSYVYDMHEPDFHVGQDGKISDANQTPLDAHQLIDRVIANKKLSFIKRENKQAAVKSDYICGAKEANIPDLFMICRLPPLPYRYLPHKYAQQLLEMGESVHEEELAKLPSSTSTSTYTRTGAEKNLPHEVQEAYQRLQDGVNDLGEQIEEVFRGRRHHYKAQLEQAVKSTFGTYQGYGAVIIVKEVWGCQNFWKLADDEVGYINWPDVDRIMRIQDELFRQQAAGLNRGFTVLVHDNKSPRGRAHQQRIRRQAGNDKKALYYPQNSPEKRAMFVEILYNERGDGTYQRIVVPEDYIVRPPTIRRMVKDLRIGRDKQQKVMTSFHNTFDLEWLLKGEMLPEIDMTIMDVDDTYAARDG